MAKSSIAQPTVFWLVITSCKKHHTASNGEEWLLQQIIYLNKFMPYSKHMDNEVERLEQIIVNNSYQHIIFDLDRTLVKLLMPWEQWFEDVNHLLTADTQQAILSAVNAPNKSLEQVINEQILLNKKLYRSYIACVQHFENRHFAYEPYQKLIMLLPELTKRGRQLSIWTNNIKSTALRSLHEQNILPYFTKIISREDTLLGKPDISGWVAIKSASLPKSAYLLVGDSNNDKLAAESAEIAFFQIDHFNSSH